MCFRKSKIDKENTDEQELLIMCATREDLLEILKLLREIFKLGDHLDFNAIAAAIEKNNIPAFQVTLQTYTVCAYRVRMSKQY